MKDKAKVIDDDKAMGRSTSAVFGLTTLRVVAGIILAAHGWLKLIGFSQWQENVVAMGLPLPEVAAPLAVAGELAGGLGLVFGLLTPVAAFGAACVMAVAILSVHLPHGLFAKDNGFEYPLLLLATAVFFMLRGAGPISVDALARRSRSRSDDSAAHTLGEQHRQA